MNGLTSSSSLKTLLAPVLFLAVVLVGWDFGVRIYQIDRFILPGPLDVGATMISEWRGLTTALATTALAAITGLSIAFVLGNGIACLFALSPLVRIGCYPYAILLQTVPIVAIAPLIIIWFGYGFHSIVIIVGILSLFPIITNTTNGLLAIDRDLLDLFRLHSANWWQRLVKLQLPGAVRSMVVGLKISTGLSVVGAIIGEYFAGNVQGQTGLGYTIYAAVNQYKTPRLFAAVLLSTLLGVLLFAVISKVATLFLGRWYDPAADEIHR